MKSGKPDFFIELYRMIYAIFKKSVGTKNFSPLQFIISSIGIILLFGLLACNQKNTNGKTIVVDVRQELIWKQGHACEGKNIPLAELEKHKTELLNYDTVIFVCETGASAGQATAYMNAQKDRKTVFKNGISWTRYQTCP